MPNTSTQMKFASAISDELGATDAADAVVEQITANLSETIDLALVFISPHHVDQIEAIQSRLSKGLKPRVLLGMTAEGVIGIENELENHAGLSVLAGSMPQAVIRSFYYEELDWARVLKSPQALGEQINMGDVPARGVLLMADPFSTPMVKLLPAMGECWPNVPVIGGMASAARQPGGNRILTNDRILSRGAAGILLGGHVQIDCTVSQGCRPIGKPYVITKSKRHLVMELGGRNALEVLQDMAEDLSREDKDLMSSNGLFVGRVINEYKERFGRGDFLIRSLMGVDQSTGYVAIADPQVRVGQTVQFHVRDAKTAEEDFTMLLEAQKVYGDAYGAALFSCNGRGTRLFGHPHADAKMVNAALRDLPLAGCFAAGEIGPIGEENHLHGHTASLAVFRPD